MAKAQRIARRPPPPPVENLWRIELDTKEAFLIVQMLKQRIVAIRRFQVQRSRYITRTPVHASVVSLARYEAMLEAFESAKALPPIEEDSK